MRETMIDVDPINPDMKNSRVIESVDQAGTVKFEDGQSRCYWNDAAFSDGTRVCDGGVAYECQVGHWIRRKDGCS